MYYYGVVAATQAASSFLQHVDDVFAPNVQCITCMHILPYIQAGLLANCQLYSDIYVYTPIITYTRLSKM